MTEEVLGFLGLMRRAGALALGAEDAFDAARTGKARLLCLAKDASRNTADGIRNAQNLRQAPLITLDGEKRQLGQALGCGECAALAILDTGFALSLCKKLELEAEIPALEERLQREKKRKAKKEQKKAPPGTLPPGAKSGAAGRIAAKARRTSGKSPGKQPTKPQSGEKTATVVKGKPRRTGKGGTEL